MRRERVWRTIRCIKLNLPISKLFRQLLIPRMSVTWWFRQSLLNFTLCSARCCLARAIAWIFNVADGSSARVELSGLGWSKKNLIYDGGVRFTTVSKKSRIFCRVQTNPLIWESCRVEEIGATCLTLSKLDSHLLNETSRLKRQSDKQQLSTRRQVLLCVCV